MLEEAITPQLADRFWSKVDKRGPTECWPWAASKIPHGYGQFGIPTNPSGSKRRRFDWTMARSHRIAWILTYGIIPEGMGVLHKCDNPPCCNPDHLFLGTQKLNMEDCVTKGRHGHGTTGRNRIYMPEMLSAAMDDYESMSLPLCKVALMHGICETTLRKAIQASGVEIKRQFRKINLSQAAEIRSLYSTGRCTYFDLASQFGVSFSMIGKIVNGKNVQP